MAGTKEGRNSRRGKPDKRRRISKAKTLEVLQGGKTDKGDAAARPIANMPKPPSNLNKLAVKQWGLMLAALGDRLTALDATTLALFCEVYAEWIEAGEQLAKTGGRILRHPETKNPYRNPWLDVQKGARKELSNYSALFGLSPHDRCKLGIDNPRGGGDYVNPFDEFKN